MSIMRISEKFDRVITAPHGICHLNRRSSHVLEQRCSRHCPRALGVNARGCRSTPSSRWRRTLSSPRLITGKFTDTAHLLETHTSWGYCRWCEEHWHGVSSRHRQSFSRDSNLKSCLVTWEVHISIFPVSRVTVFRVEGDAMVDEGEACLISQTVIDISRFHFCYSCLSFVLPCSR